MDLLSYRFTGPGNLDLNSKLINGTGESDIHLQIILVVHLMVTFVNHQEVIPDDGLTSNGAF